MTKADVKAEPGTEAGKVKVKQKWTHWTGVGGPAASGETCLRIGKLLHLAVRGTGSLGFPEHVLRSY